jgi:hypothetical protein
LRQPFPKCHFICYPQKQVHGQQTEGRSPYTLVELVCTGVEDYSPILDDIIDNTLWDGKLLDQLLDPPNRWDQVAHVDKLEELLSQDCLLVWF